MSKYYDNIKRQICFFAMPAQPYVQILNYYRVLPGGEHGQNVDRFIASIDRQRRCNGFPIFTPGWSCGGKHLQNKTTQRGPSAHVDFSRMDSYQQKKREIF